MGQSIGIDRAEGGHPPLCPPSQTELVSKISGGFRGPIRDFELLNSRIEDLRTRDGDVENLVKEALEIVVQTWKAEAQILESKIEDDLAARPDCCTPTTGNPPCRICHDSRWRVWSWSASLVDYYKDIDRIYGTGMVPSQR